MSSLLSHLHEHEANEPSAADRPSIYELLATDELRDLVQPAFRYILAVGKSLLKRSLTVIARYESADDVYRLEPVVLCSAASTVSASTGQSA